MKVCAAGKALLYCICLVVCASKASYSQRTKSNANYTVNIGGIKRIQLGLYMGAYFANKATANIYDGYGYNLDGEKNDFFNSFMYRSIVYDYGGFNGGPDYIAMAMGVDPGSWTFDQTNMPINMSYVPAFSLGLSSRLILNKVSSLVINFNLAKVNLRGDFTITLNSPSPNPQTPGFSNYRTFPMKASEQRMLMQLGYQQLLGDPSKLNFFFEGGFTGNVTKFDREQLYINTLVIDLTNYYNSPVVGGSGRPKVLTGFGGGAFGGFGLNIAPHKNIVAQILYSPTYETIRIGAEPKFSFQQSVGLRVYGKL